MPVALANNEVAIRHYKWRWAVYSNYSGHDTTPFDVVIMHRVYDAFSIQSFTLIPADAQAAFEAILLTGDVAAAYEYAEQWRKTNA